jgi:hypothetical protein
LDTDADPALSASLAGHRKNDSGYAAGSNDYKTGQYDNIASGSGFTSSNQTSHHPGRDAAGLGAAGLVGEHEYRKHDTTSGLMEHHAQSAPVGPNSEDFTGVNEGVGSRNRLHKDPPAGHPAAQESHVPASGSEREKILKQGQGTIDNESGVANPHVEGDVNVASNY